MKKWFIIPALSAVFSLSAVNPGDRPGETASRLEWIDSSPVPMGVLNPEIHKNIPQLRAFAGQAFFQYSPQAIKMQKKGSKGG